MPGSRSREFTTAIATLALASSGALAQGAADPFNSSWFPGLFVQPTGACPPWALENTAVPEIPLLFGDTSLSIATSPPEETMLFEQRHPEFDPRFPLLIEFQVAVQTNVATRPDRAIAAVGFTTGPGMGNTLYVGLGEIFLLAQGGVRGPGALVPTNDDVFVQRIEVDADGTIRVKRDGALLFQGATYASADHGGVPRIRWGDLSGDAEGDGRWASLRHNGHVFGCNTNATSYDASWRTLFGVPPIAACTPWTLVDHAPSSDVVLEPDALVVTTLLDGEDLGHEQRGDLLGPGDPSLAEVNLRFVAGSSQDPAQAPASLRVVPQGGVGVVLHVSRDEVFLGTGPGARGPSAFVDTDDFFHTYRVEIARNGAVQVFQDRTRILQGTTYADPAHGPGASVAWGDLSPRAHGESRWEGIRHNLHRFPCDRDGDGVRLELDCDDADGCNFPGNREACDGVDNDCDGATDEPPPGGHRYLYGIRFEDKGTLAWARCGGALVDAIEGDLTAVRSGGGFSDTVRSCLVDATSALSVPAPAVPGVGRAFYYLGRPQATCGTGGWDEPVPSMAGPRSFDINASAGVCP